MLAFCDVCEGYVDEAVATLDLASPDCGFPWYSLSKLEHQLLTVRHLQHHAAQLADRLRNEVGVGVRWVGSRPSRG
ncbi:MAG: hypothetical protein OEO79_04500 [Gemmatimonadota bacterium]|nr:hypothetical protein [Gemmatimonadota bacterium]